VDAPLAKPRSWNCRRHQVLRQALNISPVLSNFEQRIRAFRVRFTFSP
jgi:hypothetical protein